jgi:HEAT repeat protein/lysophospholipase L1-like esterase
VREAVTSPRATRSRARELGANLALATTTVVVLLGGAELVARLTEPPAVAATADYITDWQAWDGDFYTVKSTAVGWPPWEDYNTEGLRDREHALEKRPGSWRVVCLGDSVTLGWGIRPQQAWPQVLEELAAASGRDLEVMNVALGGWSTRQELIAYRRIARRYRPDQVLLGICLNDVPEMQNNLSRPPKLVAELHRRSALVRRLVGARRREIGAVEELFTAPDASKVRGAYELMFADLCKLRDEVRADGSSFAILVFPFRLQVAPGAPPPTAQDTIAVFCQREEIPLLDLLPAIAVLGPSAFHDYDHFGPEGARLVAAQVLESGLLSGDAGSQAGAGSAAVLSPDAAVRSAPPLRSGDWKTLAAALQDPLESRRAAAARGLATLGEAATPAVPALVAALGDPSRVVRAAAAWALGDVGPAAAPAVPALRRLLQDEDPFMRAGAVFGLGAIGAGARAAAPAIVAKLDDPDERVRWRAADALAKIGLGADSVDALVRLVCEVRSPGRGMAAEALGRLGPEAASAVPELIAATSDRRPEVRWRAVWALGRIGPAAKPAVLALRIALADPDVRWRSAEALGGIGPSAVEAVPDLIALLRDPSSSVRWRAVAALGAIGSRQAAPALAGAADDAAENVRLAAISALSSVGAEPALAERAYLAALDDTDARVRLQAIRGLGRLGTLSSRARRALEAAGNDPNESVRAQVAKALHKRGG